MDLTEKVKKLREQLELDQKERQQIAEKALSNISEKDTQFHEALALFLSYINSTYSDKYEESMPYVDNTWLKYGEGEIPAGHNIGQAVGYLKRYLSKGFPKSYNTEDLKKAAHYILIELARRSE